MKAISEYIIEKLYINKDTKETDTVLTIIKRYCDQYINDYSILNNSENNHTCYDIIIDVVVRKAKIDKYTADLQKRLDMFGQKMKCSYKLNYGGIAHIISIRDEKD